MYFEIENTPEHVRRARRSQVVQKHSPKEECPRLVLAPFSRPPQVVFDNVLLGTCCVRDLEVLNPSKQTQQLTLGKALPPGLVIQLPGEWLVLEPETCYCLSMMWTPTQPTALRETIRFTNEQRGRYDIIVVLKSAMNIKGKTKNPKGFKISPGKIRKKQGKKSPVAIYKKKSEVIYNTTMHTTSKKTVVESTHFNVLKPSNRDNISPFDLSINSNQARCPFDSPTSIDLNFDTTEIFSNMRKTYSENIILQDTYDKSCNSNKLTVSGYQNNNALKPSNKNNFDISATELFDNLTFTPLKTNGDKSEKLNKGPQIILSLNSDSELDDSLDVKISNKENETHSIICITSTQPPNKQLDTQQYKQLDNQIPETPSGQNKKIPNTSSPKEMNSPNFSMNTELSRISDLSFVPPRFSTERKNIPRLNIDTYELFDDPNARLNSDTYTKDSPSNTPLHFQVNQMHVERPPHFFLKEQPKYCKQVLFKESQQCVDTFDKNYLNPDVNIWNKDFRNGVKSPPRSITPPLQSIPEESNMCDTQVMDTTNKRLSTFTLPMNRTFDKLPDRSSISTIGNQTWSKKSIRAEHELWKMPMQPARKSTKPKLSISKDNTNSKLSGTFCSNKSINQNISFNQMGNIYSQSTTVDPFLSASYFYDEDAVHKFEAEFKRWLNYILTPPADLESNIEQTIDVGKAWIENRNKEVPVAPTREQVSSVYHNNHRLESLRISARALLMSPEITQVFQKLNVQIDKKLIAIRTDRNLHLDVGLQKIIMELLLSYNPLWLRIGLEAIYGLVLPLKSNSDIDGLTSFIIHRMFKNPHLKNKHSKSSAPNMLLPAYMEAIKKFTLKKFFMLVFFLDQAKQKKLISHDPCLFCRNAICKESREIIIRFTRELIAGIGDITKHLRPLGYVVSHKQSYLDEYKYAVHNIALDIRDGVRLTKVMEIILMKNGLLNQLRTPAISRLQKIHNVQVAFNALKEANFDIHGEITAQDIADGHREKTLSLLWQLIHEFRAPLFEKAANIIQTWWRKKYEVILEKRKEEELLYQKVHNAASKIQCWWRRIQYNRLVEWQMKQTTSATMIIQKYCRKWLCRSRFLKMKKSVLKIEDWYRTIKIMSEAKALLDKLKIEKEKLMQKSATLIQSYVRRWLCKKEYKKMTQRVILVQSIIRSYILRKRYNTLKKSAIFVQRFYKGKILMRQERQAFIDKRKAAIVIQSYVKMIRERSMFRKLKKSVDTIECKYLALLKMRVEAKRYQILKRNVVIIQKHYRMMKCRKEYSRQRNLILTLQNKFRAYMLMKKERATFIYLKNAAIILQRYFRSSQITKTVRQEYILKRNSALIIQRRFRAQQSMKIDRTSYMNLRNAVITVQGYYRALLAMRDARSKFTQLRNAVITVQRKYRAQRVMKSCKQSYIEMRNAIVNVQRRFRAQRLMRLERSKYWQRKSSCIVIQNAYKSHVLRKRQRQKFLQLKHATIVIQKWYRCCKIAKDSKQQYVQTRNACITIQRIYKAYIIGRKQRQEYIKIRTAVIHIQSYYRAYLEMKTVRQQFIQLKAATVTIQRYYKMYVDTKNQRQKYLRLKCAAQRIQNYYRCYLLTKTIREEYFQLRKTVMFVQSHYRSMCVMRAVRQRYLSLKQSAVIVQQRYRALKQMRIQRLTYLKIRTSVTIIQRRFKAYQMMKTERTKYLTMLKSSVVIQRAYKAYIFKKKAQEEYAKLRKSVVSLQHRYRALLAMRKERETYMQKRIAIITIQRKYRAKILMSKQRAEYLKILKASITIQRAYKAYKLGTRQRQEYLKIKHSAITIQRWFRCTIETQKTRDTYLRLRIATIMTQRRFRIKLQIRETCRQGAAKKIQTWYRSLLKRNECRKEFLKLKRNVIFIQSTFRMFIERRRFVMMKNASFAIQRFYRSYKITMMERQKYIQIRMAIIKLQAFTRTFIERRRYLKVRSAAITLQKAYRQKKERDIIKIRRTIAATCIQKNVRRYLAQTRYQNYRSKVLFLQRLWRGKLITRLMRCEFLQNRRFLIKLQARIRGYLVRKYVEKQKIAIQKTREEQKRHRAASVIQAHYRGHKVRAAVNNDKRVAELRRRWREGALKSTQLSLKDRNDEALDALYNIPDIETVIRAFRSLELSTEVFPMMYDDNASFIVQRVFICMSVTNRSISSIELLKSAAALLVNLTRYKVTGPKIYNRDRIAPVLKFMCRFSNSETQLFCILCTYLWLFSKYDGVKQDLTEYLNIPENQKLLSTIKSNVERMKRMASNARNKLYTPQTSKFVSHTKKQPLVNHSMCSIKNESILLPAIEPDYGITRADKPKYFEDAHQAMLCLFSTFNL